MQWILTIASAAIFCLAVCAEEGRNRDFKLSKEDIGKVPKGWKAEKTGKGEGSIWRIVEDNTAPSKTGVVLAQTAESPNAVFNICVAEDTNLQDLELGVAFKAIHGKNDQGGGLVWRYQDANNYYIARMNPLEDNYRVYKVVDGRRHQLATQEGIKVPAGEWHRLKIVQQGGHIECFLDGDKKLDVKDDTFPKPGKIGLWTKSDAQTYFDDLRVIGK
jgi:predicted DNA-binding transcriptional regulator AlpA